MANQSLKSNLLTGALVGGLLTIPLTAIFFLANQLAGLPFIPFDLLDWSARNLPGGIVRFGIDFTISVVSALNLAIADTAKTAEHIFSIIGFCLVGIVAGAVLFAILRALQSESRSLYGIGLGLVLGVIVLSISAQSSQPTTADPFIRDLWVVGAFLVWGWVLNNVYANLQPIAEDAHLSAAPQRPATSQMPAQPVITSGREGEVYALNRRQFMIRLGGSAAVITVVGAGLGALAGGGASESAEETVPSWSDQNPLPNAAAALQPAPGTRPEFTKVADHYRVDINALPIVLHEEDWTLEIKGMVRNPKVLTLNDLRSNYEPLHQFITLSCISNPIGGDLISTQRWTGVSLNQLMREAGPTEGANYLYITSADGFYEMVTKAMVMTDERIMLTYAWDGLPLTPGHGFPLRIYIPDLYGMKQPKWITSIEFGDTYEEGYWVRRDWDEVARVRTTSVIDTIAVDNSIQEGDSRLVPIGGIAYAGARSIRSVEVRVDDGDWMPAQLRDPISDLTWVIWRYDWPFQSGEHVFAVRCVDGKGGPQIDRYQDTYPSGATGIYTRRASL